MKELRESCSIDQAIKDTRVEQGANLQVFLE